MSKVLYIKANAKEDNESRTFQISQRFVEEYQKNNPMDTIITLDLYKEGIGFLPVGELEQIHRPNPDTGRDHPILKYAFQFLEADKYILAEPMWNLGIPAILKAYIDYVTINGITFKYTESGAVGLCSGKKAVNIMTTGGYYSQGPYAAYEMCDKYLRGLFGFLGINDFTTILAEGLDVVGNDVGRILQETIDKATQLSTSF